MTKSAGCRRSFKDRLYIIAKAYCYDCMVKHVSFKHFFKTSKDAAETTLAMADKPHFTVEM